MSIRFRIGKRGGGRGGGVGQVEGSIVLFVVMLHVIISKSLKPQLNIAPFIEIMV